MPIQQKDFNLVLARMQDVREAKEQPWWRTYVYEQTMRLGLNVDKNEYNTLKELQILTDELVVIHAELDEAKGHKEILSVLKVAKARQDEIMKARLLESKRQRAESKQRKIERAKERRASWTQTKKETLVYNGLEDDAAISAWTKTHGDLEKIEKNNVPFIHSMETLSLELGVSYTLLRAFSVVPKVSKVQRYVSFEVPKKSGGVRLISAPTEALKQIQRAILDNILNKVPLHQAAHGFVPEKSIKSNAEPHVHSKIVINLDLKDFFPSIDYRRVKGAFAQLGYSEAISSTLAILCTQAETIPFEKDGTQMFLRQGDMFLPQGAPTSPAITNLICRRLDARLDGLARALGFSYTRYADDLTFAAKDAEAPVGTLLKSVRMIVKEEDFRIHPQKTRVMRAGKRQEVTGVVVNDVLGIDKARLKRFRAFLHHLETKGLEGANWEDSPNPIAAAMGFAGYIQMIKGDGKPLAQLKQIVQKLQS